MRVIYADNNATTQVAPEVSEAMAPFFTADYFNPSSMYEPARRTAAAIMQARRQIAGHLGVADPKQILFTSCATESNNTAIFGTAKANPHRRHIITTAVEHPAVLEVCKDLERSGYEVTFLGVDGHGNLDLGEFVRALRPDTLLVSIMHANNETGVIFPIPQLSRITKETDPSIVFHTDATQSVGKIPIDLAQEYRHVDLLSFSGHKLHAPKGIGVLYIKRGTPCRPLADRRAPGGGPPGRDREHALHRRAGQGRGAGRRLLRGRTDADPQLARPAGNRPGSNRFPTSRSTAEEHPGCPTP